MKAAHTSKYRFLVVLAAGLAGILLRVLLYQFGPDDRGLISQTHPLHMVCLAIALGVGVYLALSVRNTGSSNDYRDNFPANRQMRSSVIVVPACFLVSAFATAEAALDRVDTAWTVMSFAVVPCMAYTLYCQMTGKRSFFLFHTVICLYFAVDMICRYRFWSGNPQLADYTFHLFACASLCLTAYYRTAFDVGMGSRRMLLFMGMMSVFFCMLSFVGPESFSTGPDQLSRYVGGALWAAASMCTQTLPRRRQQPAQEGP